MKEQQPTPESRMRPGFILTLGGLSVILVALVALAALRSSKLSPAPADAAAPSSDAPTAEAAPEPQAPPMAPTPAQPGGTRPEIALLQELPKVQVTRSTDSSLSDFKLSFKLDPRLTQSLYMGDRWLAPPTYLQVGRGEDCTVEASVRGLNAQGKAVNTPATWWVANPEMVEISPPGPGNTVKLRVVRPGQTTVEVSSQGITKRLPLHATSYGGSLMVAMAQQ